MVGELDDLVTLIMMSEDHDVARKVAADRGDAGCHGFIRLDQIVFQPARRCNSSRSQFVFRLQSCFGWI